MSRLAISLLGTFQVACDAVPITEFESNKVRALLAYLAVESDRPHTREALAALLWPDSTQEAAMNSLRNALANLRRAIGDREAIPPYLLIIHETVQFNPNSDNILDAASVIRPNPNSGPGSDIQARIASVNAYRGPFLEGLSVPDSSAFEEWVSLWRERIAQKTREGLGWLADYYEGREDYPAALEFAHRQVALDPWMEDAHCQVMRLLALSGQREQALRQYHTLIATLQRELAAEPSESTTRLYKAILSGDLSRLSLKSRTPHNLPEQITPLIGREEEIEALNQLILSGQTRLICVTGAGGTGKTRLALEVSRMLLPAFPDGIYLVEMNSQMSAESLLPAVAQAVGLNLLPTPLSSPQDMDLQNHLWNYLHARKILLVLDSFETILDAANQVSGLLRATIFLKILITSRARLNLESETVFPLEGLFFPAASDTLDDASDYPALELFDTTARLTNPAFTLTSNNRPAVAEICRLTQGMPLGILLAASWSGTLEADEILIEIQNSLDFLSAGWRSLPDRQRSLRATFEYSWGLLAQPQRIGLMRLSVFPGTFSAARAQQICDVSLSGLKVLIEQSLLQRSAKSCFRMHDLLRQFIREKLEMLPDEALSHWQKFCQVYLDSLAAWSEHLKSANQIQTLEEMNFEQDNFHFAWDWALQHATHALSTQTLEGLCRYFFLTSRYQEGLNLCRQSAQALQDMRLPEYTLIQAGLARWQAFFLANQGEKEPALQIIHPLVQILQEKANGAPAWAFELASACLFEASINTPNPSQATVELVQQGLKIYRSLGTPWEIAWALLIATGVHDRFGNRPECYNTAAEALEILGPLGDPYLIARSKTSLAYCYVLAGEFETGLRLALELGSYYHRVGDRYSQTILNRILGIVYYNCGLFSEAKTEVFQYFDSIKTQVVFQIVGRREPEGAIHLLEAGVCLMLGQYAEALEISLDPNSKDEYSNPMLWVFAGIVYLLREDLPQALHFLERSLQGYELMPRKDHMGWPLSFLGLVFYRMHDAQKARNFLLEAMQFAIKFPMFQNYCFCLAVLALILAEKGEVEQAVELYAAAATHPWAKNSVLFYDVYQKRIDALAAVLPADVIHAAQQRGTGQNMRALVQQYLNLLSENPDFCAPL